MTNKTETMTTKSGESAEGMPDEIWVTELCDQRGNYIGCDKNAGILKDVRTKYIRADLAPVTKEAPAQMGDMATLEYFDSFCRFIDGIDLMGKGFVENDFMSKPMQKKIRAILEAAQQQEKQRMYVDAEKAYKVIQQVLSLLADIDKGKA